MTDLIVRLALAIFRQEGRPVDHPNPGNCRDCPWFEGQPPLRTANGSVISRRKYPDGSPVFYNGQFWVPRSRVEGEAGVLHIAALHLSQGNTLKDFIGGHPGIYSGYAPAADHNDPATYIKNVSEWAEIPNPDVPMWNYLQKIPT